MTMAGVRHRPGMVMRLAFLAAVVSGLVAGLVIAGVRLWDRDGQEADAGPGAVALPSEATAEAFASAWVESDTQRIYALLDSALKGDAARRLAAMRQGEESGDAHSFLLVVATRALLPNLLNLPPPNPLRWKCLIGCAA